MLIESIQSAVVPYRLIWNEIEVLLVTSIKKKKWIIPKGYVEYSLSPFESAKKEAFEEAGITGSNETVELGEFVTGKNGNTKIVRVFLMKVIEQWDDYPEKNLRKRRWYKLDDAIKLVDNDGLKDILIKLKERIL
jgi:8-oxo-dGTP pyrophosphatase MutT (NUDIX family)